MGGDGQFWYAATPQTTSVFRAHSIFSRACSKILLLGRLSAHCVQLYFQFWHVKLRMCGYISFSRLCIACMGLSCGHKSIVIVLHFQLAVATVVHEAAAAAYQLTPHCLHGRPVNAVRFCARHVSSRGADFQHLPSEGATGCCMLSGRDLIIFNCARGLTHLIAS